MSKKFLALLGGTGIFFGTAYMSYSAFKPSAKSMIDTPKINVETGTIENDITRDIYDRISSDYDKKVGMEERIYGVKRLRRKTISKYVDGAVLEVATGTGRNFDAFVNNSEKIKFLHCTDYSRKMLHMAYSKYTELKKKDKLLPPTYFKVVDAHKLSEVLPKGYYDTVIDSFGLCSFENPGQVVLEMCRVCKPGGKLVFIEHGKSSKYQWLTDFLNKRAPERAKRWGCWWNRDIESIIRNCEELEIKEVSYHHLGTSYVIVAIRRDDHVLKKL